MTTAALAAMAHAEAERHEPRTPGRRAASALRSVLLTCRTVRGARIALAAITDTATREDAARLLDQFAEQADTTATEGTTS